MIYLLISYLSLGFASSGAGSCNVDSYEPRLKPIHYGYSSQTSGRQPASLGTRKIKPPYKTAREKEIYQYLKKGDFNGADLNGDGIPDVKVVKNLKGYRKITYSFPGSRKVKQINVFNPKGRLVKEKVFSSMDGQVDYLYECKDQVCETRSQYVAGKPNRLYREIRGERQITYKLFEREDGKFQLKSETTQPRRWVAFSEASWGQTRGSAREIASTQESEGDLCYGDECYEKKYSIFLEILDKFRKARRPTHLKKIDDFYESRVGVLIHKECFDGRYDYDVEEAVSEAIIQGFSCMGDLKIKEDQGETASDAVYKSHIPRLANLFTRPETDDLGRSWSNEQVCNLNIFPEKARKYVDLKEDCEFIEEVPDQPKVFCRESEMAKATREIELEEGTRTKETRQQGWASGSAREDPVVYFNKEDQTKVYRSPAVGIDFGKKGSIQNTKSRFKATIWHELMHNLGYSHPPYNSEDYDPKDWPTPDYAWFCEAACFADSYSQASWQPERVESFGGLCHTSEALEGQKDLVRMITSSMFGGDE